MKKDYLLNEWHCVYLASELKEEPQQVFALGERVVIYRTKTEVHAFKDLCIHRGAALSLGKVKNGLLVCPYHAWEYNTAGECEKIPALPCGKAIPSKAKATVYRCIEHIGFIWVNIGEDPAPLVAFPEYDQDEYRTVAIGPYDVKANAPRIVENFLDIAHLMFVHEGMLGDADHAEIPVFDINFTDGRYITSEILLYQPNPDGRSSEGYSNYVYEILSPMTARFKKKAQDSNNEFSFFITVVQEKEEQTKVFMLHSRNFELDQPDEPYTRFTDILLKQDIEIIESQKPELLPLDLQEEMHLKSDAISIAYRRWLKKLGVETGII
ncbi:aromatic ring-hydroxylating dioxygenase subunit alpha [Paenibacillus sp. WQ 127069]|uniref:Aromatic ring-hydroxylating dioxygenase subunit alpha n=1 Tax=Paenibacillus baimaensis TaxID=2982185 RepID=A0ABT2UDQ9_9BACL|nr:aromatic ring-hydroxylating dioxygenase subunit alpha [Paenibacillus sp. WQ 127069]MCU6792745.1 aromatic ring-hydroxylating dioxygenase subunit alpha [Paenibacillus sp. WQ 127069]